MSVFTEETVLHPAGESAGDEFRYDVLSSGGRSQPKIRNWISDMGNMNPLFLLGFRR